MVTATDGDARQVALVRALESLGRRHNALSLSETVDPERRGFHGRPAEVIGADRFVDALLATVTDPALRGLPLIGSVDQVSDNTDLLERPTLAHRLRALYRPLS